MKIVSIVGARPQFVKVAAVSRALQGHFQDILVHTGQHYDHGMSAIFFEELGIAAPQYHLGIGSGTHGSQTGQMLAAIEEVLLKENPGAVIVYGDTNSTLAGALAAVKLHIPLAHVEAGLRSFNKKMPEEVNRRLTDHASDLLFCPTVTAVENLAHEGIEKGVHLTGDVMYDALLYHSRPGRERSAILKTLSLAPKAYLLATIHRAENTDDPGRLGALIEALAKAGERLVLPLHPRTRETLKGTPRAKRLEEAPHITVTEPLGYLDMLALERHARLILTDSGGVQKEAYLFGVPCITLRDETEWVETVASGANVLTGADTEKILAALGTHRAGAGAFPPVYGDGRASEKIAALMAGIHGEAP
ncbi:MAG: UDP-N-acetylglucosamine 2-epimerase (non-hydrolyzing) [Candidatus Eremiobacteraeota bacterium]|nr:UDP-N-acetylglucosamine 2-epimerase (non-hydrolyzing) [Candidatus Eremiobacteraeota bacterium]